MIRCGLSTTLSQKKEFAESGQEPMNKAIIDGQQQKRGKMLSSGFSLELASRPISEVARGYR